jgi:hypothetical protein
MPSTEVRAGEPKPSQKDYVEIIKSDLQTDQKYIQETGVPAKIIYYCRDCEKIVSPSRIGKKFRFSCAVCKGENVAFGSDQSIRSYYKLPAEEKPEKN